MTAASLATLMEQLVRPLRVLSGRNPFAIPVEVSALTHAGLAGTHARSPLLRLQTDERLIALIRRGNHSAFEALVARYQSRLLAFCRHMLSSREDAEDVLQEVFAASYNAILADEREINVRPWLYRIARNRSLNHLRKAQAIGVDSMDVHLSEHGLTTADKVHKREEFRQLMSDVGELPETQRTALLLREIDALSYEQIAEAMETTVPSVKSLLVRARVSLAEAAEARLLTCEEVREELGEVAEGLRRTTAPVRRHLRTCERCQLFRKQLRQTNRALAAIFPVGPLLLLKKALARARRHGRGRQRRSGRRGRQRRRGRRRGRCGRRRGRRAAGRRGRDRVQGRRRARRRRDRHRRRRRGQARQGPPGRQGPRRAGRQGRGAGAGRSRRARPGRRSPRPRSRWPSRRPSPSSGGPPPPRRRTSRRAPAATPAAVEATPTPTPTPTATPDPGRHAGPDGDAAAGADHRAAARAALRAARGRHGHAADGARPRRGGADADRLAAAAAARLRRTGSPPGDALSGSGPRAAPLSAAPAG